MRLLLSDRLSSGCEPTHSFSKLSRLTQYFNSPSLGSLRTSTPHLSGEDLYPNRAYTVDLPSPNSLIISLAVKYALPSTLNIPITYHFNKLLDKIQGTGYSDYTIQIPCKQTVRNCLYI